MKHFQNYHRGMNLFLFRFRESGRPFNQAYGKVFLRGLIYGVLVIGISSCGSSKPRVVTTKKEAAKEGAITSTTTSRPRTNRNVTIKRDREEEFENNTEVKEYARSTDFIDEVVENAKNYEGVKYRYGGTTIKGMDCSGLISVAFKEAGKSMPRTSRSLYAQARELSLDQVRKGDFLFFATGRNKNQVNHVALITRVTPAEIEFIHSTTSRGVITSTLNEAYWINAFLRAGRID
jgi:cell wall-associated NlpC family hydrolase